MNRFCGLLCHLRHIGDFTVALRLLRLCDSFHHGEAKARRRHDARVAAPSATSSWSAPEHDGACDLPRRDNLKAELPI